MDSTRMNGLGRWIDCVLVFDDENLLAVDQVIKMMIHASATIYIVLFLRLFEFVSA